MGDSDSDSVLEMAAKAMHPRAPAESVTADVQELESSQSTAPSAKKRGRKAQQQTVVQDSNISSSESPAKGSKRGRKARQPSVIQDSEPSSSQPTGKYSKKRGRQQAKVAATAAGDSETAEGETSKAGTRYSSDPEILALRELTAQATDSTRVCIVKILGADGTPLKIDGKDVYCKHGSWQASSVVKSRMKKHMMDFHLHVWEKKVKEMAESHEEEERACQAKFDHERTLLEKFISRGRDKPDTTALLVELFCEYGLPFRMVESPLFRDLLGPHVEKPSRVYLKKRIKIAAAERLERVSQYFVAPVLAIDVGTVFHRYLVGCLVERGNVFAFLVQSDEEMQDGRMTCASIKASVQEAIANLKELGVRVVAVVADNASNMQGIQDQVPEAVARDDDIVSESEEELDEDWAGLPDLKRDDAENKLVKAFVEENERDPILFVQRCVAHVIQLMVNKDLEKHWRKLADSMLALAQTKGIKITSHNETRWSSRFRTLCEAHIKLADHLSKREATAVKNAILFLEPFHEATQHIQSDSATMVDTLVCLQHLHDKFSAAETVSGTVSNATVRGVIEARIEFLINGKGSTPSPLYACAVWFLPIFERHSEVAMLLFHTVVLPVLLYLDPGLTEAELLDAHWPPKEGSCCTREEVFEFVKEFPERVRSVALMILELCPTEASVERAFSTMKNIAKPLRNSLHPCSVRWQMIVNSFRKLQDGAERVRNDAKISSLDEKPIAQTLVGMIVRLTLDHEQTHESRGKMQLRTLEPKDTCLSCNKKLSAHSHSAYFICGAKQRSDDCARHPNVVGPFCSGGVLPRPGTDLSQRAPLAAPLWICPPCQAYSSDPFNSLSSARR